MWLYPGPHLFGANREKRVALARQGTCWMPQESCKMKGATTLKQIQALCAVRLAAEEKSIRYFAKGRQKERDREHDTL